MNTISKTYTLYFELSFADNYKFTKCGKCFNTKTGREIKQTYNSGSIGYNIKGKFYSLPYLRKRLRKISTFELPF